MNNARTERIGRRIKLRREDLDLTQAALAEAMDLSHRQTLSQIENGHRRIRPDELAAAAAALDVEIDFFTDPFAATGEAAFSFRADDSVREEDLACFQRKAEGWLTTYRELAGPSFQIPTLTLRQTSSYEAAQRAAEDVGRNLRLGTVPARRLSDALSDAGILVLHVDSMDGVSGAASSMEGLHAILIDRQDSAGRRNFDLAHELFHVLTWDRMVPAHIDSESQERVEQLANNFASALLMPEDSVRARWSETSDRVEIAERVRSLAGHFGVSGAAMKWRLHALGLLEKTELPDDVEARIPDEGPKPQLFSREFVSHVHAAVESGRLSLRKAASILGMGLADFADLCRTYGRPLSYDV